MTGVIVRSNDGFTIELGAGAGWVNQDSGLLDVLDVNGATVATFQPLTWDYIAMERAFELPKPTAPADTQQSWEYLGDVPQGVYKVSDRYGEVWQSYMGQMIWRRDTDRADSNETLYTGPYKESK